MSKLTKKMKEKREEMETRMAEELSGFLSETKPDDIIHFMLDRMPSTLRSVMVKMGYLEVPPSVDPADAPVRSVTAGELISIIRDLVAEGEDAVDILSAIQDLTGFKKEHAEDILVGVINRDDKE